MNEFAVIKKYFSNLSKNNKGSFDLSDDIFFDYKKKIGISIDSFIEGRHFLNFINPNLVIKKALRGAISDLICKGITPKYYFMSCSGNKKHLTQANLAKIQLALKEQQKKYNVFLAGGDTSHSNRLSITLSVVGYSKKKSSFSTTKNVCASCASAVPTHGLPTGTPRARHRPPRELHRPRGASPADERTPTDGGAPGPAGTHGGPPPGRAGPPSRRAPGSPYGWRPPARRSGAGTRLGSRGPGGAAGG